MPRDGSGVYSTPPGTHGTPNTTILSANYNSNVDDVAADLNTPRPIVAGGTGATTAAGACTAIGAVAKAGDTMSGDLTIAHAGWPRCIFNVTDTATGAEIDGRRNGSARWSVLLLDGTAESGSNAGSDFWILRYSDAGVQIDAPLFIKRSNGAVNVANSLAVATAGSITGLGEMLAVSANGPSKVGISIQYVDHGMILNWNGQPDLSDAILPGHECQYGRERCLHSDSNGIQYSLRCAIEGRPQVFRRRPDRGRNRSL